MKVLHHISSWMMLLAALLCSTLQSCRGTENRQDQFIDFSADNEFLENKSTLVNELQYPGSTFRVYADFNRNTGDIDALFRGTEVSYTAEGVWYYQPLEYWYTDGDYDFRAVWPASADVVSTVSTGKSINIQNYSVVSDQAYDLMVAYVYRDMSRPDFSPVDMIFRHALAAVNVIVRKEADDPQNYTLKDTYFKNMYVAGNFIFEGNPATPEALSECWNYTYFQTTACLHQAYHVAVNTSGNSTVNQFIMPQEINGTSVAEENKCRLGYTLIINGNEVSTEVVIPYIEWLPGKVYTYRVTLKASGADVEVLSTEWDKVDVTAEDIYGKI